MRGHVVVVVPYDQSEYPDDTKDSAFPEQPEVHAVRRQPPAGSPSERVGITLRDVVAAVCRSEVVGPHSEREADCHSGSGTPGLETGLGGVVFLVVLDRLDPLEVPWGRNHQN